MLNKAPIFVNGFARGGTNLFINLIASHPDVCVLSDGETHFVFHGKKDEPIKKWVNRLSYLPIYLATRQHVFRPGRFYERQPVPRPVMRYIDLLLFVDKVTTRRNRFKAEATTRSLRDKARGRILCKNINGVVYASGLFSQIYPDATFFGFVRNGLALCEGYVRRGDSAERFGQIYEQVCSKLIEDEQRLPNYHILKFEDMMNDPLSFLERLYALAGLDIARIDKIRLQAKQSMDKDGVRRHTLGTDVFGEVRWFSKDQLSTRFRKDVNDNQIARLSEADKEAFLRHARRSMEHFGYLTT